MPATFPNTAVPGRLRDLLSKLPNMGVPSRASQKWLASVGYSGGNAMTILPVLRFVGVISQDGTPTQLWQALRKGDGAGRAEFGAAVRKAYADLFATHPDAHRKDAEALRNFFRAYTTGGEQVQTRLVQTFKVLTEFGDFDGDESLDHADGGADDVATTTASTARSVPQARTTVAVPGGGEVTLNVNVQLQLPDTADAEVYEKLFAAMRKHLMGLTDSA